jgi:hypothetical protein
MIELRIWTMCWMNRWPLRNMLVKQFTKADAITLPDYDRAVL